MFIYTDTYSPLGYHQNGFVATHAFGHMDHTCIMHYALSMHYGP